MAETQTTSTGPTSYRDKAFQNLVAAYGQESLPDFQTFNAKMDTEKDYAAKAYANLKDYYGEETLPDFKTFGKKLYTPDVETFTGLPHLEANGALNYAIQRMINFDKVARLQPGESQEADDEGNQIPFGETQKGNDALIRKANETADILTKGTSEQVGELTKQLTPFINEYKQKQLEKRKSYEAAAADQTKIKNKNTEYSNILSDYYKTINDTTDLQAKITSDFELYNSGNNDEMAADVLAKIDKINQLKNDIKMPQTTGGYGTLHNLPDANQQVAVSKYNTDRAKLDKLTDDIRKVATFKAQEINTFPAKLSALPINEQSKKITELLSNEKAFNSILLNQSLNAQYLLNPSIKEATKINLEDYEAITAVAKVNPEYRDQDILSTATAPVPKGWSGINDFATNMKLPYETNVAVGISNNIIPIGDLKMSPMEAMMASTGQQLDVVNTTLDTEIENLNTDPNSQTIKAKINELKGQREQLMDLQDKQSQLHEKLIKKYESLTGYHNEVSAQTEMDNNFAKSNFAFIPQTAKVASKFFAEQGKGLTLLKMKWDMRNDKLSEVQKEANILFVGDAANNLINTKFHLRTAADAEKIFSVDSHDNIDFRWKGIMPSIAKVFVMSEQMGGGALALQAGTRAAILGAAEATGVGSLSRVANSAILNQVTQHSGIFLSTALPMVGPEWEAEMKKGLPYHEAFNVALLRSGANGALFAIPARQLLLASKTFGIEIPVNASKDQIGNLFKEKFVPEYYEYLTGKTIPSGLLEKVLGKGTATGIKKFTAVSAEQAGLMNATTIIDGWIDNYVQIQKHNAQYEGDPLTMSSLGTKKFWWNQFATFANGVISMLPTSAVHGYVEGTKGYESLHYGAASNADIYMGRLRSDFLEEKMDEPTFDKALMRLQTSKGVFNTHRSNILALPTQEARIDYFDLQYRKNALSNRLAEMLSGNPEERYEKAASDIAGENIEGQISSIDKKLGKYDEVISKNLTKDPEFHAQVRLLENQRIYTSEFFEGLKSHEEIDQARNDFNERMELLKRKIGDNEKLKDVYDKQIEVVNERFNDAQAERTRKDYNEHHKNLSNEQLNDIINRPHEGVEDLQLDEGFSNRETETLSAISTLIDRYGTTIKDYSKEQIEEELKNHKYDPHDLVSIGKSNILIDELAKREREERKATTVTEEPISETATETNDAPTAKEERKGVYEKALRDHIESLTNPDDIKAFIESRKDPDGKPIVSPLDERLNDALQIEGSTHYSEDDKGNPDFNSFVSGEELNEIGSSLKDFAKNRINELNSFTLTDSKGNEGKFYKGQQVWVEGEKYPRFVVAPEGKKLKVSNKDGTITINVSDLSTLSTEQPSKTEEQKADIIKDKTVDIVQEANQIEETPEELTKQRNGNFVGKEFIPINPFKTTTQDQDPATSSDPSHKTWRNAITIMRDQGKTGDYRVKIVVVTPEVAAAFPEKQKKYIQIHGIAETDRAVIITDKDGIQVYFDEDGKPTKLEEGGRLAVGFLPIIAKINILPIEELTDRFGSEQLAQSFISQKLDEIRYVRSNKFIEDGGSALYSINRVSRGALNVDFNQAPQKIGKVVKVPFVMRVADGNYIGVQKVTPGKVYIQPENSDEWFSVITQKLTPNQADLIIDLFRRDKQAFKHLKEYDDFYNRVTYIESLVYSGGKSALKFDRSDEVVYYRNDRDKKFEVLDVNSRLKQDSEVNTEHNTTNYPVESLSGETAKERLKEILTNNFRHNLTKGWTSGKITELSLEDGKISSRQIEASEYAKENFLTHYQEAKPDEPERLNAYIDIGDRADGKPNIAEVTKPKKQEPITPTKKISDLSAVETVYSPKTLTRAIEKSSNVIEGRGESGNYKIGGKEFQPLSSLTKAEFRFPKSVADAISSLIKGEAMSFDTPEGISDDAFRTLSDEVSRIYELLEKDGGKVITNDATLFDSSSRLAGQSGIISMAGSGAVRMHEIVVTDNWGTDSQKAKEQLSEEMSAKSNLFYNQYGQRPTVLTIFPFEVQRDTDGTITDVKRMKSERIKYDDSVNRYVPSPDKVKATPEPIKKEATLEKPVKRKKEIDTKAEGASEVKPEDKKTFAKKTFKKSDESPTDDSILKRAKSLSREPHIPYKEEEVTWFKSVFGEEYSKKRLDLLYNIANSDHWGSWNQAGVRLLQGAEQGTLYHEAWHEFSQLYLTKEQKGKLYEEARKDLKDKSLSDKEVEESLAEDFRNYVLSGGKMYMGGKPVRNTIFNTIINFLRKYLLGKTSPEEYYEKLFKGNFNKDVFSKDNAIFGELYRGIEIEHKPGDPIDKVIRFDNQETQELMDSFDGDLADIFEKKGYSLSVLFDKTVSDLAFKTAYTQLKDRYIDYYNELPADSPLVPKYEAVLEHFEQMKREHQERSSLLKGLTNKYTFEENDSDSNQELQDKDDVDVAKEVGLQQAFDRQGNEQSSKSVANKETLFLIATLPKYEKGKRAINSWGRGELSDISSTWNILSKHTEGTTDYSEFFYKIAALANKYPEFQHIVGNADKKILPRIISPDAKEITNSQMSLRNKVLQDLSKPRIRIVESVVTINKDGTFRSQLLPATRGTDRLIEDKFNTNFQIAGASEFVIPTNDGNILNTKMLLKKYPLASLKEPGSGARRAEFLEKLGFRYEEDTKNSMAYRTNIAGIPVERDFIEQIYKGLEQLAKLESPITNPATDLSNPIRNPKTGKIMFSGERNNVKALLSIEAENNEKYEDFSVIDAEGNRRHEIQNWNELAYIVSELKNDSKYPSYQLLIANPALKRFDIERNPIMKSSLWLNSMFIMDVDPADESFGLRRTAKGGNSVFMELLNYAGLKIRNEEGVASTGLNTTSAQIADKLLMDMNSLLTSSITENVRHGDKSSAFAIKIDSYQSISNPAINKLSNRMLPVDIMDFSRKELSTEAKAIFFKYFKSEIERMREARFRYKDIASQLKYYRDKASKLSMFDEMVSDKFKKAIEEKFMVEDYDMNNFNKEDKVSEALGKELEKFFFDNKDSQYNRVINRLKDMRVTPAKAFSGELTESVGGKQRYTPEQLIRAYVVNDFILKQEQLMTLYGDTAFFKNGDFFKRASGTSATGTFAFHDKQLNDYLTNHPNYRLSARFANENGAKINIKAEDGTVGSVVFKDVMVRSKYIEVYKKHLEDFGVKPEMITHILSAYEDMTEGDGQGWITLDEYRIFKQRQGNWFSEHERAYTKSARGEALSPEEMFYFMPIKAQYYGELNSENDANSRYFVPGFHKFSLTPLLPHVIKDTHIEQINQRMLENNIGYGLFESGSKGSGFTDADGQYNNFYENYDERFGMPQAPWIVNMGHYAYLKEQLNIDPSLKKDIIYPTQLRKLLFYNMFNHGVPIDVKYDPVTWTKIVNHEYRRAIAESPIFRLSEEYDKNIQAQTQIEKDIIIKELDIQISKNEKGETEYNLHDYSKLVDLLRKEFISRGMPDKVVDFLDIKDGKLKYSLDASLSRQKIESVLMAIANNRLIRQKTNGEAFINTASSGFEKFSKEASEKALEKYGSNDLPYYNWNEKRGKIDAMKIKVGLIGDFKNLLYLNHQDGKQIGTLERLNESVKDEKWLDKDNHRKMVSISGMYIPGQGMNSIEFGEVYHFLPEEVGSALILPTEVVARTGKDFDIDKLPGFMPNIRKVYDIAKLKKTFVETYPHLDLKTLDFILKNNRFEDFDVLTDEEKALAEAFKTFYGENINEFVKSAEYIEGTSKKGLQNRNSEIIREVAEQKSNFVPLITPNATFLFHGGEGTVYDRVTSRLVAGAKARGEDPTRYELTNYSQTAIRSFDESLKQFQANLAGKTTLGIGAVNNTYSQLFKHVGLTLNPTYTTSTGTKKVRIWLPHNIDPITGRPTMAGVNDHLDENTVSEVISQMMNGYVDVAKKPWIFFINASKEVASTIFYLNNLGVDHQTLFSYINQPAIRQYVEGLQRKKFLMGQAIDPQTYKDTKFFNANVRKEIFSSLLPKNDTFYKKDKRGRVILKNTTELGQALNEFMEHAYPIESVFNPEYFDSKIGKSLDKMKEEDKVKQAIILNNFVEMMEQSGAMTNLQSAYNFDTNKDQSIVDTQIRLENMRDVIKTGLFPESQIKALGTDTVLKGFANQKFVMGIYKDVFEVTNHKEVNKFIVAQLKDLDPSYRNLVKDKFIKLFKNDLIQYIFQNYVRVVDKGKDITAYEYLKKNSLFTGPEALGNELYKFVEAHPQIKGYKLVDILKRDVSKRSDLVNIGLKLNKLDTDDINTLYENFSELMNYNKADAKTNKEIQLFFRKLAMFSFLQSGLNFSRLSFTQTVPDEVYANLISNPLKEFAEILHNNPQIVLRDFMQGFMNNNPTIFRLPDGNKEPYRFKDYVNFPRNREFAHVEEEADSITEDSDLVMDRMEDTPKVLEESTTPEEPLKETNITEPKDVQLTIEDQTISNQIDDLKSSLKEKYPGKESHIEQLVTLKDYKKSLDLQTIKDFNDFSKSLEEIIKNCI